MGYDLGQRLKGMVAGQRLQDSGWGIEVTRHKATVWGQRPRTTAEGQWTQGYRLGMTVAGQPSWGQRSWATAWDNVRRATVQGQQSQSSGLLGQRSEANGLKATVWGQRSWDSGPRTTTAAQRFGGRSRRTAASRDRGLGLRPGAAVWGNGRETAVAMTTVRGQR